MDFLWLLLSVILFVDLLLSAVRSSLANVRVTHLVTAKDERPAVVERTMSLLESRSLRVMLRVVIVILHFMLAGIAYALIVTYRPDLNRPGLMMLALFLVSLLVVALEYFIEGRFLRNAETWTLRFTPLARFFNWLFTPISALLLLILGAPPSTQAQPIPVTEDELKSWVEEDQPESTLEKGERRMIYSIFQFGETLCREIMVPRMDVLALDINTPLDKAVQSLTGSGHSRVPVYEETIDNVIGVLYAKDLLRVDWQKQTSLTTLRNMLRPAYFVPEAKKVDELLAEMRSRRVHIAIVVDEYGGMAGLVTLEDITEEIFGEIRDEYDQSEELPFQMINPDEYIFQGRIDLDDFNDVVGTHLVKDVAETLGGYISSQVGHVPAGGEELQVDGWLLTVEQVAGRRIRKVRVRRQLTPAEMEENGSTIE